jgi:hypothetical protein
VLTGADFVFVHVPRTGGKSITRMLLRHGQESVPGQPSRHTTAREARALLGEARWSRAYRFGFVRNPWDRLLSLYLFHLQTPEQLLASTGQAASRGFVAAHRAFTGFADFAAFLRWFAEGPRGTDEVERHRIGQLGYLGDEHGALLVDRVGRYEHLARDAAEIAAQLGVAAPSLPWLNGHLRPHYGRYYDVTTRALVERACADEIRRFDYAYEPG